MDSHALASRDRGPRTGRFALIGGLAIGLTLCLSGCDSRVGIEGTDYSTDAPAAPASPTTASPIAATALPVPEPGELAVTVALAVPDPGVTSALTRWAEDLRVLPPDRLQDKCWTLAPQNVTSMYSDKPAILNALIRPGVDDGATLVWRGSGRAPVTVVAQRADIDTGYACPRVFAAGVPIGFNDADARHTVRRYLARITGAPLDPADQESTHPLVCPASPATWDPTGTGRAVAAPLAGDPGQLDGVVSFDDQAITSKAPRGNYITVSVPVMTSDGTQQDRTFTLKASRRGYCIGDVSP